MFTDNYGQQIFTEDDICEFFLKNPNKKIGNILVEKSITFPANLDLEDVPSVKLYEVIDIPKDTFDFQNQNNWFVPDNYKEFDVAKYVLDLCKTDEELQRVGQELIMFQERNMFPLLQYLKYLVDTMRENNIVWGVGRGSSVASFVLFLLGVHRINSLYYDLSIDEFLK